MTDSQAICFFLGFVTALVTLAVMGAVRLAVRLLLTRWRHNRSQFKVGKASDNRQVVIRELYWEGNQNCSAPGALWERLDFQVSLAEQSLVDKLGKDIYSDTKEP